MILVGPSAEDVFEVHVRRNADVTASLVPELLWTAAGSLNTSALAAAIGGSPDFCALRSIAGPWAAAVSVGRTPEVVLVTDPLGVMPLFWARTTSGAVVAGSWLAALVDRPDVDDRLDLEGLLIDRGWEFQDRSTLHRTHFCAVSRVPGGCVLRIRPDGSTRLDRYWDAAALTGPDATLSLHDCADLMRERLDRAIRRAIPAGGNVAAHLSGGLDSTAITTRANQALSESGRSLSAGYSWAPSPATHPLVSGDERHLPLQVAAAEDLPLRFVDPTVDDDAWFQDLDPTRYPDSTHFRERFVLPKARADGVQIILSGWGGDESASYNGFGGMRTLLRNGRIGSMLTEARLRADVTSPIASTTLQRLRTIPGRLVSPAPAPVRLLRHPLLERAAERRWHEGNRRIAHAFPGAAAIQRSTRHEVETLTDIHERMVAFLQRGHLQQRTGWWYQTGRLMGIDYRYPLLDLDVVEAALRMPWWAFFSHGWDRPAFRLAVEPWVPAAVAWNVTKDEPALLGGLRDLPPLSRRRPPRPDAAYDDVMDLAELSWEMDDLPASEDAPSAHRPIWARADLAPRRH